MYATTTIKKLPLTYPDYIRGPWSYNLLVRVQPALRGFVDEATLLGEVLSTQPHAFNPRPAVHSGPGAAGTSRARHGLCGPKDVAPTTGSLH